MPINVIQTISGVKDAAGGVSRSVPGLCNALANEGCNVAFVTQKPRDVAHRELLLPSVNVDTHLLDGHDWPGLRLSHTPGLKAQLTSICAKALPCVLHDHGLWLQMNHVAANVAGHLGIKRVISPRGMLEAWSLQYRGWKKKIAWRAYQHRDLQQAAAFSATSRAEACAIRELGLNQPIAVIPNGIDVPVNREEKSPTAELRTVLFMSRIHPKKGLLDLVLAWSKAQKPGWRLVIAGPDEGEYLRVVQQAAVGAGVMGSVEFPGPLEGSAKRDLLCSAGIFVLPSFSENFGNAIGEALASGIPVIATTATPWEVVRSERCGWWIETGAEPLAAALSEAMALGDGERSSMGLRGRALIEREFSWRSVARKHVELYRWLLDASEPPDWLLQ